jgi:ABC-type antimicrobial peptide transport system permease subunit
VVSLFRVVDARVSPLWIVVQDNSAIQLMPAAWARDGYWELFFDGDKTARDEYTTLHDTIVAL